MDRMRHLLWGPSVAPRRRRRSVVRSLRQPEALFVLDARQVDLMVAGDLP
jgi:hypothetical protein